MPIGAINSDFAQEEGPTSFSDGQTVAIAGIISSVKTKTTRNNSLMAYVVVEDDTAAMELLCFSRVLDQCGDCLKANQAVLIRGKLSVRDEKAPQILCDSVSPLSTAGGTEGGRSGPPPAAGDKLVEGKVLYLRLDSASSPAFRHISLVMEMFPGSTPVRIRLLDTGKLVGGTCLLHASLLRELEETIGKENIVVR